MESPYSREIDSSRQSNGTMELTQYGVGGREGRYLEIEDIRNFKLSAQQTIEEKNFEISRLTQRVDSLTLENEELRLLLKRALENDRESTQEIEKLRNTLTIQNNQTRVVTFQQPPPTQRGGLTYGTDATFLRYLRARVSELQRLGDGIESSLDSRTLVINNDNPYEDEAVGGIDPEATTVGCQPDPVGVGHEVQVVIITRNADGIPCRGSNARDFEVRASGNIANLTPVTGSRSCFSLMFTPQEVGRCGVIVTYRGHSVLCTTSSVARIEPFDPRQTSIMLSPNPVQAGVTVTGTIITKDSQGLVTAAPPLSSFSLSGLGNTTELSCLRETVGCPSQATFSFIPLNVGKSGVSLTYGSTTQNATVEVVLFVTPHISTMHTVLSCSPNPAKVDEEVTVMLTTRSAAGVPTAGASVDDLRDLRPVGGASQLQPFQSLTPSTFKTTFIAKQSGAAGVAVSFMGLTLYATTIAVVGPEEMDVSKTGISCNQKDISVDMPVDIIITSRDRWGAPHPCGPESDWSISAEEDSARMLSMENVACCTITAQFLPLKPGRLTIELLYKKSIISKLFINIKPRQIYDPKYTKLVLRNDTGQDITQHTKLMGKAKAIQTVSPLDVTLLVISTYSVNGMAAAGPSSDDIVIRGAVVGEVTEVTTGLYKCLLSDFQYGTTDIEVDIDGITLLCPITVITPGTNADPTRTTVRCNPPAVLRGDTISVIISFYDAAGKPAPAPDTSQLVLEPIGEISSLTRVGSISRSTLEVVFVCEGLGLVGLVVNHSGCSYECTACVCDIHNMESGPLFLDSTDVSLAPDPVRPGNQVQCLITVRDFRYAPLHDVDQPLNIVLRPLENTARVSTRVQAVPGTASTWVATFTAGREAGETGVAVEVNGHVFYATAMVEEELFDALDDELQRLRELTNRLHDDTERDRLRIGSVARSHRSYEQPERVAEEQLQELELTRKRYFSQNQQKREARNVFPHFGLEVTDSIKFRGGLGARFEYAGVKVVAVKGASLSSGVQADDIITKVEGKQVEFLSDFRELVQDVQPGQSVELVVRSKYDDVERNITIVPERSSVPSAQRLGYTRRIRVNPVDVGLPVSPPRLPRVARDDSTIRSNSRSRSRSPSHEAYVP